MSPRCRPSPGNGSPEGKESTSVGVGLLRALRRPLISAISPSEQNSTDTLPFSTPNCRHTPDRKLRHRLTGTTSEPGRTAISTFTGTPGALPGPSTPPSEPAPFPPFRPARPFSAACFTRQSLRLLSPLGVEHVRGIVDSVMVDAHEGTDEGLDDGVQVAERQV